MLKKIGWVIAFVLLVIAILYVRRYLIPDGMHHQIPKSAFAVVKVDLRGLEHHFLIDFLTNPIEYFKSTKEYNTSDFNFFRDLSLPKSLLLFTPNNRRNLWLSSPIEIKNKHHLTEVLSDKSAKKILHPSTFVYYETGIADYIIDGEGKYLRIAVNADSSSISNLLTLIEATTKPQDDPICKKIHQENQDILYIEDQDNFISLNFNKKEININGNLGRLDWLEPGILKSSNTTGILELSANLNSRQISKVGDFSAFKAFENYTKLSADTLFQNFGGRIWFGLQEFKLTTDTIETFDYDDDFNKVLISSIDTIVTPSFLLDLDLSKPFVDYMFSNRTLVPSNEDTILAILPIVTTYFQYQPDHALLGTNFPTFTRDSLQDKLYFDFDCQLYRQSSSGSIFELLSLPPSFDRIQLNITDYNHINGKITMRDNRNSLVQLMKD